MTDARRPSASRCSSSSTTDLAARAPRHVRRVGLRGRHHRGRDHRARRTAAWARRTSAARSRRLTTREVVELAQHRCPAPHPAADGRAGEARRAAIDDLPARADRRRARAPAHRARRRRPARPDRVRGAATPDEVQRCIASSAPTRSSTRPQRREERFVDACARSRRPSACCSWTSRSSSGIGNVYRAELLFRARLNPHTPGRARAGGARCARSGRTGRSCSTIGVETGQMMTMDGLRGKTLRGGAREPRRPALGLPPQGPAVPGLRHPDRRWRDGAAASSTGARSGPGLSGRMRRTHPRFLLDRPRRGQAADPREPVGDDRLAHRRTGSSRRTTRSCSRRTTGRHQHRQPRRPPRRDSCTSSAARGARHHPGPARLHLARLVRRATTSSRPGTTSPRTSTACPRSSSDEENFRVLDELVDHFEKRMPEPVSLDIDEESARRIAKGTVGIRLRVTRFDARAQAQPEQVARGGRPHHRRARRRRPVRLARARRGDAPQCTRLRTRRAA